MFGLFSSDTLQVKMFVCPTVSELRFYGCWSGHPCFFKSNDFKNIYFVNFISYIVSYKPMQFYNKSIKHCFHLMVFETALC